MPSLLTTLRHHGFRLGMLCMLSLPALAHVNHGGGFRPVLDPLPNALAEVSVQLTDTLAPQLLVENRGAEVVTILGQDGKPFLRIGPQGVEANTRHAEWLKTYLPGGLPGRKPEAGDTPLWKTVKASRSWGWFDSRLKPANVTEDSLWRIPVLIGSRPSEIRGRFKPALQAGYWQADWRSKPVLPDGIQIVLIPGQPYGMMLSNRSTSVVTVLDRQGQPFIRLSKAGTEANLNSSQWRETATQQGLRQISTANSSGWQMISTSPRYTWVEPRTRSNANTKKAFTWQIQLRIDTRLVTLTGESRWRSK